MKGKTKSAKAAVMTPEFRPRREESKKGKRSYKRKPKHKQEGENCE